MEEIYRKDYDGEYVVLNTKISGGKRITEREWIDNPIKNQHISGRATIIASGESRRAFNVTKLPHHRGGLLGRLKLQTYGTGELHNEMLLDFFVTFDDRKLQECIDSKYTERSTVYTSAKNCLKYPGEFYLIPQSMRGNTATIAAWLACFDGHKEIFLLGFDGQASPGYNNNIYIPYNHPDKRKVISVDQQTIEMTKLMLTYPGVDFYYVNNNSKIPEAWEDLPNLTTMTYRNWITHCDI